MFTWEHLLQILTSVSYTHKLLRICDRTGSRVNSNDKDGSSSMSACKLTTGGHSTCWRPFSLSSNIRRVTMKNSGHFCLLSLLLFWPVYLLFLTKNCLRTFFIPVFLWTSLLVICCTNICLSIYSSSVLWEERVLRSHWDKGTMVQLSVFKIWALVVKWRLGSVRAFMMWRKGFQGYT